MRKLRISKKSAPVIKKKNISPFNKLLRLYEEYKNMTSKSRRYNIVSISVHNIAQQYYCEKQIEMKMKYGEFKTEAMLIGIERHEQIEDLAIEKPLELIAEEIKKGKRVNLIESMLIMKYRGIFILGMPDCVVFSNKVPKYVIERKTSRSPHFSMPQHIQALLYCLLLDSLGFYTEYLKYIIIVTTPTCGFCQLTQEEKILKLSKRKVGIIKKKDLCPKCSKGDIVAWVERYDRDRIIRDLNWALKFWLKKRKAIPTKKEWKCRACSYRGKCPASLAKRASK